MFPILYNFSTNIADYNPDNCIGTLTKVKSATVRQVLNNEYELKMTVLETDPLAEYIFPGVAVMAKPNYYHDPQIFIIRTVNYANNEFQVEAEHIKALFFNNLILAENDGSSTPVNGTPEQIFNYLITHNELVLPNYFSFTSPITRQCSAEIGSGKERNLGEFFFDDENGLNRMAHGEFKFDNFTITYYDSIGSPVPKNSIRYGTNLSSFNQELSDLNEYTHVLAYADVPVVEDQDIYSGDVKSVRLYPPQTTSSLESILLPVTGSTSDYTRVFMLDVTSSFRKKGGYVVPSGPHAGEGYVAAQQQIKNKAQSYINGHANQMVGVSANIKVTYENELYKFEKPALGDTVYVIYEPFNYKKLHRITEITFDVINEKVISLNISDAVKRRFTLYDFINLYK